MLEGYSQKYREDYIDLFCEFEKKKRCITEEMNGFIPMNIPESLTEECSLNESLRHTTFRGHISLQGKHRMKIDRPTFKAFYQPACDGIVRHIKELFLSPKVDGVRTILMVGGFSESKVLQEEVRKAFPHCQVLITEDASEAVLIGAVLFGHSG